MNPAPLAARSTDLAVPETRSVLRFTGERAVELHSQACPKPGPGQVLVRSGRTLISTGTELTCFTRRFAPGSHWDNWVQYPFYTGYLNAGTVIAVGAEVTTWAVGDRIASREGHASHVMVDVSAAHQSGQRIPDGMSDESACWMGLGKIVQVGIRAAEQVLGDVVVVIGLGLLGQLAIQYARLNGASRVIGIDTSELRLRLAKSHGATDVINDTAAGALAQVRAIAAEHGVDGADIVYDVTGHPAVLAQALPLARKFGKVVLIGDPGDPSQQRLTSDVITRGVRIVAGHDGHPPSVPTPLCRWSAQQMSAAVMTWIAHGSLRTADLITHRFAPQQAAEAFELLDKHRDEAMGVVLTWD